MKSYYAEALGIVAFTFIGVGVMLSNTGNNYLVVALVHGLTIAATASAIFFNKRYVIHCPPIYLEDIAPWSPGTALDAITAFFLVIGFKTATARFLNQQVLIPSDRTTKRWEIEQVNLRPSFG